MDNITMQDNISAQCLHEVSTASQICTFWFEGILLLIFGVFGIVGNVTSIFILSKIAAQSFFDSLLIALTSIDTIFIFFTVVDYSLARVFTWPWPEDSLVWVYLIPKFTYPLNNICFCSSVFLTVLIACERYLAVCHPIAYRQMSISSSNRQRLLLYLLPCFIVSIVLNIPKYFETVIVTNPTTIEKENGSILLGSVEYETTVILSDLRANPIYTKYYTFLTRLLVTGILPITSLLFFNLNIYLGLKAARRRAYKRPTATTCAQPQVQPKERKKISNETSFSLILLFIVAVFLCCQFPRLVLNMAEFVNMEQPVDECGTTVEMLPWFSCLTGFSHLLLIFNASVNFLIYCSLNNFKAEMRKVCSKLYNKYKIFFKKPSSPTTDMSEIPLEEIAVSLDERNDNKNVTTMSSVS